jgi:hypothetical protein
MRLFGLFVKFVAHFAKHFSSILLPTFLKNSPIMRIFELFAEFVVHFAKHFSSILLPTCLQCSTFHKLNYHAILWIFRGICCALCQGFQLSFAANMSSV